MMAFFEASVCDINQKLMPQLRDKRPKRLIIVWASEPYGS